LSIGDQSLHLDGKPLTHKEIFPFLYDQFLENPKAAFVGYFLGYDFAQWFKSLPEAKGWSLLTREGIARRMPKNAERNPFPWPVRCDGWEFDILGAKRFKLRPDVPWEQREVKITAHTDGTFSEHRVHPFDWMYVCDVGSFFQTSFLVAINPRDEKGRLIAEPLVSDDEYAMIERGKGDRDTAVFDEEMIRYNLLENAVLPRLMEKVDAGLRGDQIVMNKKQWIGPGQAAQAWMKLIGVPSGEEIRTIVPKWARDAARQSFYGGWFEITTHGVIPSECHAYDINSAYPAIIANLPCLLHGTWTQGEGKPGKLKPGRLRLLNAAVKGSDPNIGAMPHRRPDGTILRPNETAGWYWEHEVMASKRAKLIDSIVVESWVEYEPCGCIPPLGAIAELYEGRLKVGKNSSFGKSKKLVYNSAYGKLAQSIGMPKYSNPIYASLITAGCRTMILDAIATHPMKSSHTAMVATDGVVFFSAHPSLDIHETRLGAWDHTVHSNLSLMMPGLYWDDASRQRVREGKSPKVKSRGVPASDLAKFIDEIDRQWELKRSGEMEGWPSIEIPIKFGMVSAKLAASQNRWFDCGKVLHGGKRELNSDPKNKRSEHYLSTESIPGATLIRSTVWPAVYGEPRTTAYDKVFGEDPTAETWQERQAADLITPDGTIDSSIHAVLPS
jgi:hypothetical protein